MGEKKVLGRAHDAHISSNLSISEYLQRLAKIIINTREKNVHFLAPTTAAPSHGILSPARASRDAAMLKGKTKEPFRNSSVGIATRLQAGRRRNLGSIVCRCTVRTFVTSQRVQTRSWATPPQIQWLPGGDALGAQI